MTTTTTSPTAPPAPQGATTCWKCKGALRTPGAAFCNVCGAAQRPDDPAAARAWQERIVRGDEQPAAWGLSFLWILAWPIMPLLYPAMLAAAFGRLRRHVAMRVQSPALSSPRFTAAPEGQAVAARVRDAAKGLRTWGVLSCLLCYLLIAAALLVLFVTPAKAPHPISYERALSELMEGDSAYYSIPIRSADQYEEFWKSSHLWSYDEIDVNAYPRWNGTGGPRAADLPVWSGLQDTVDRHRPYEYVQHAPSAQDSDPTVYRVQYIYLRWKGTQRAAVAFYILVGLLYLAFLAFGLIFFVRFMRHRKAEALAAAYARADPALHDRLLADVRGRNTLLGALAVPFAILGWMPVAFPVLWAAQRHYHERWERESGVADAFATA